MKFSRKMLAFALSAIMILGAMAPVTAMAAETTQPSISAANVTLRCTGDPLKINLTYSGDDAWAGKTDEEKLAELQSYANAVETVTIIADGKAKELTADQWSIKADTVKDRNTGAVSYRMVLSLKRTAEDPILNVSTAERTKTFTVKLDTSGDKGSLQADFTATMYGAETLQVRLIDKDGNVKTAKTFTKDEIKQMSSGEDKWYNTICGMRGLTVFRAQGADINDIFKAAGITFEQGMTLKLRTNDSAKESNDSTTEDAYYRMGTFKYEHLMQDRYAFPGVYTDESLKNALLSSGRFDDGVKTALGGADKTKVDPMIAYQYDEVIFRNDQTKPAGAYDSLIAKENTFRFLFGIAMDPEDSTKIAGETTTWSATYTVFGMDVIEGEKTAAPVITPNGGEFKDKQEVSISCETEDAAIYYTTDGSDPKSSAARTEYKGTFTLEKAAVVKAYAVKDGIMPSDIVSAEFTQPKTPADTGKTDGKKGQSSGTATGDDFSIMLWAGALILAAAAGGTVIALRKKNAGRSR